jgi:acetyl-CoA/propionyl-CoA carboxylase carboxyl transferase subunit
LRSWERPRRWRSCTAAAGRRTDRTHRPALTTELAAQHARLAGGLDRAAELGVLNAVIEPANTRRVLAAAIAAAPAERGEHGNIPL